MPAIVSDLLKRKRPLDRDRDHTSTRLTAVPNGRELPAENSPQGLDHRPWGDFSLRPLSVGLA